jgi:hypothetical protein
LPADPDFLFDGATNPSGTIKLADRDGVGQFSSGAGGASTAFRAKECNAGG